uniref:Uncharacterized protein n=1 Tax=Anguilla anguilla TaxID=7936 RepID=A0A0E9WF53_ANGAN
MPARRWTGKAGCIVDKAGPQKWCEPTGDDNVTQKQELMEHSQGLIVESQIVCLTCSLRSRTP